MPVSIAGCAGRNNRVARPAFRPVLSAPVWPASPSNAADADPPEVATNSSVSEPLTLVLPVPRPLPPRTRATAPEPEPPKSDAPLLAPQLSASQQADAQRQTQKDIQSSESSLQIAFAKQLNAFQKDLTEKIRESLAQAREAIRVSDWVRARNLAQKARVLADELVKSL